ncbi:hypothetical protein [Streptomyces sp. RFCAC02]|uniref:hypothetical protein n=1 Tax=Streptomyces sp. RFCAC02 TaxID=2499143 RepID=UPI00102144C2|nr:hypothetical protein [Streptomyces sp. RFCAC02]
MHTDPILVRARLDAFLAEAERERLVSAVVRARRDRRRALRRAARERTGTGSRTPLGRALLELTRLVPRRQPGA